MPRRRVAKYVALVGLAAATFVGMKWWVDRGVGTILVNALALPTQNARTVALGATRASLAGVTAPNVYSFVKQEDVEAAINAVLKKRREETRSDDTVVLESAAVLVRPEGIGITLPFHTQRALSSAEFAGSVEMDVAPSANGAYIELHPMTARVRLDRLRLGPWSFSSKEWTTRAAAGVLNGVVTFAARRIAGLSLPLTLGAIRSIDTAKLIPGATVDGGGRLNVRLGADEMTVATGDGGLHILGRLITLSDAEFESIVSALEAIKAKAPTPPTAARDCGECGFDNGVGAYFACARRRAVCAARTRLGTPNTDLRLTAPQALVLSELRNDPRRADLYGFFEPLLTPFGTVDADPPEELTDIQYATEVRTFLQEVLRRRGEVEDPAALPTDDTTHVAVHRRFLSQALVTVLQPMRALPLGIAIDDRTASLDAPVSVGPAPDLRCTENARPCESEFSFETEPNRACAGGCSTTSRHCVFGACVDVPGIDLACEGARLDCNRLKEQEKAGWAIRRGAAFAAWKARKDVCEATKITEIAGCRLNQEWLNTWGGQTLGDLDGIAKFSRGRADFRLDDVVVAEDLSSISVTSTMGGGAHVQATVVYRPADTIQGRIVCAANWGGDMSADVGLKPQPVRFVATLEPDPTGGILLRSAPQELLVSTAPPPGIALLKDLPQIAVACPPVALAAGTPSLNLVAAVSLAIADSFKIPIKGEERRFHDFLLEGTGRTLSVSLAPRTVLGAVR